VSGLRKAALAAIAVLVAAASLVSFAESYRALYLWAAGHGLRGVWAYSWPLQVDTFVAVGELALLVALRVAARGVTVLSVAGNIGHVAGGDLASQATAAVPPLAAAAALAVGLGVLKRVVAGQPAPSADATPAAPGDLAAAAAKLFAGQLASGQVSSIRAIRSGLSVGQPGSHRGTAVPRRSQPYLARARRRGPSARKQSRRRAHQHVKPRPVNR
jgi:hypothetical protein